MVVTQVVPFPLAANIPVVARYQAALKATAAGAQPGFISLEGYLVGRAIAAALEKVDGEPTRAGLMQAIVKPAPSVSAPSGPSSAAALATSCAGTLCVGGPSSLAQTSKRAAGSSAAARRQLSV